MDKIEQQTVLAAMARLVDISTNIEGINGKYEINAILDSLETTYQGLFSILTIEQKNRLLQVQ